MYADAIAAMTNPIVVVPPLGTRGTVVRRSTIHHCVSSAPYARNGARYVVNAAESAERATRRCSSVSAGSSRSIRIADVLATTSSISSITWSASAATSIT